MEEVSENGKETSRSAHANGMNEMNFQLSGETSLLCCREL